MWRFERTETTSATPEQLWARYVDPTTWPQWDHGAERVTSDGPLSPLFVRLIGRGIAAEMPAVMAALARLAEAASVAP